MTGRKCVDRDVKKNKTIYFLCKVVGMQSRYTENDIVSTVQLADTDMIQYGVGYAFQAVVSGSWQTVLCRWCVVCYWFSI